MKKIRLVSIGILIITLLLMGINLFVHPLADWMVRLDGILMIISVFVLSFTSVKLYQKGR